MAKDKEKLKRLKKQQKERTAANKEKQKNEPQKSSLQPHCSKQPEIIRDFLMEQSIFEMNEYADSQMHKKVEENWIPKNQFEKDMRKGVTAYRSWHYAEAAKAFLILLEKYPKEGVLYYYIANAFSYMAGGMEYSLRFYQKALELTDYVEIWLDYGNILNVLKRTVEAAAILETARKKYPKEGAPAMLLASVYTDEQKRRAMKEESIRKKRLKFNTLIREWESKNQLLKPQIEDFV